MRKFTLTFFTALFFSSLLAQQRNFWSSIDETSIGRDLFVVSKSQRPTAYKIFQLNEAAFKSAMSLVPSEKVVSASRSSFIISFPMPDGTIKQFKVVDAPVMHPDLAAKYPGINSYSGQGVEDPTANIRFDVSPAGVHASIMSANFSTVYIDKLDGNYYRVVYRKDMTNFTGKFDCLTEDIPNPIINNGNGTEDADDGKLRKYRLAMISGGEFSLHFIPAPLPTHADSIAAVLAAQNSHMTRANQVYERDFGVRMELVPNNDLIIYLNPVTDPITNPNSPSGTAMQATIDAVIGSANYDIGHTESKGNDNGNAGCIGCVCTNGFKGRGWTVYSNPSLLEWFVIDYLCHEMGHQFGANHTFSFNLEGTGVNIEPGSGVTIMGYAGIVPGQNVAPHSIEIFSVKSIEQITNYIKTGNGATCADVTITGNTAPTVSAGSDYTIPVSTPFKLTGTATDPDPSDVLTYNWEQIDNRTGAFPSIPSATATNGPMFRTYLDYSIPERTFPELQYILTGANGFMWEVLPSVGRTMNFRFIAKDNHPGAGNNKSDDMVVTTASGIGPFGVTVPNTTVSWEAGSTQTVTWSVNGSNGPPVNCSNVNILFSSDGGLTFPITLVANTSNDGTENITVPGTITSTARIKVEAVGNIFFDISNANFNVIPPPTGFTFSSPPPAISSCPAGASMAITLNVISNGGFTNPVTLSASGNPGGTTVSFSANPVTPTAGAGTPVTVTLNGTNTLSFGSYVITVLGTATGAPNQTRNLTYTINAGAGPAITGQPSNQTICAGANTSFSITSASATAFQWQVSTDGGANYSNVSNGGVYSGATTATLTITGATAGMNNYRYRAIATTQCGSTTSSAATLTVNAAPAITGQPSSISICNGNSTILSVTATGAGLTYQWQSASACGGPWSNIPGATSSSVNVNPTTTTSYQVIVSGTCTPPVTSNCATVTVVDPPGIITQPANATACEPTPGTASFSVTGSGAGIIYQWQLSTNGGGSFSNVTNGGVYSGATTATLTITGATPAMNGYQYQVLLSNATCTTPVTSNAATLTVNTVPSITAHPQSATLCEGNNITLNVTAIGTGLTYQWRKGGVSISGANSSSYNINGVTTADAGSYDVVVSGACPPSVTSNAAVLNVNTPITITTQPSGSSVCATGNAVFTVVATGTSPTYQWQESTNGGTTWTNINNGGVYSGATTSSLSLTAITAIMNANQYRVTVTGAAPCGAVNSGSTTLNVTPQPVITAAPFTSLLPGRITTLSVNVTPGPNLNFVWYLNGTPIPGATGNSVDATVTDLGNYHVTITNTISGISCTSQIQNIKDSVSGRLFIYPSPNGGQFTVSYYNSGGASTGRTITIFDSKGRRVYNRKFTVVGPYTLIPIDIRPSNGGVYHVVVGDNNGKKLISGKVLIQ